jgi:hypothetical protein
MSAFIPPAQCLETFPLGSMSSGACLAVPPFLPIPRTSNIKHLKENVAAANLLPDDGWNGSETVPNPIPTQLRPDDQHFTGECIGLDPVNLTRSARTAWPHIRPAYSLNFKIMRDATIKQCHSARFTKIAAKIFINYLARRWSRLINNS